MEGVKINQTHEQSFSAQLVLHMFLIKNIIINITSRQLHCLSSFSMTPKVSCVHKFDKSTGNSTPGPMHTHSRRVYVISLKIQLLHPIEFIEATLVYAGYDCYTRTVRCFTRLSQIAFFRRTFASSLLSREMCLRNKT